MDKIPGLGLSIMHQIVPENTPFCIRNQNSKLYLTALDARIYHSPVIQRKLEPLNPAFKWVFARSKDSANTFLIRNVQNQYTVLDVSGASKAHNAGVFLSHQYGHKNQQFTLMKHSNGSYTFKSVHADLYLSIKDSSTHQDAQLVQITGSPAIGSRFILEMC